ncbi:MULTISPECIES: alpha/beta fold hydrolase [unclassified Pseudomonas]|uniref:alpha/beta fold hydrolase n=1 Tax=unclassified Pseudomonas TaxID=196821 RepID=UPI00177DFF7D|nr:MULTISPECIES: alpha/beta fold hydrolase [unclassified Pseudomonas]MBD8731962.1 alpha/beta fold hydrolase [Pseudomonas sp. CFBP 13710]MBD8826898.1 alpha/beta fold hydrolase [Pseudomonas sp. CFBP 13602]
MLDRLILLPGWGLGNGALDPLVAALRGLAEPVQARIEALPEPGSIQLSDWLDALDERLPDGVWLGGWSLGGMLAAELAARRGERCRGLLTLASNPCFVARADWPEAMPAKTFEAFLAACEADPKNLLKRFASLCAQGAADPRGLSRRLAVAEPTSTQTLVEGLHVLAELDTRAALQAFAGPQLHLFAGNDSLVPVGAVSALRELLPEAEIGLVEQTSHAFMLEDSQRVAGAIQAFLRERGFDE